MQNLNLIQSLGQRLSPQQIQFIKLLQVSTLELETRIKEEMEINPALEEGEENQPIEERASEEEAHDEEDDLDIDDYLDDDYTGYKMQGDGNHQEEDREIPISSAMSLHEQLLIQLGYEKLTDKQKILGKQLIGSIEADGYIRRSLEAIANDLAFSQNVEASVEELEEVLRKIQHFDPPGIAARDLKESLLIQLKKQKEQDSANTIAQKILEKCFNEFVKKHYGRILTKLQTTDEQLKEAVEVIVKLNPKPGGITEDIVRTQYLTPDFILAHVNGREELRLSSGNVPELRVSSTYSEMLKGYKASDKKDKQLKDTVTFVKQKLDAAKWFIDAVKQRQQTLLNTMNAIIKYQREFFDHGDDSKLRPMILKDIAQAVDMDVSTISRVASSKSIQTEFGIFPLKYFFSEGLMTEEGKEVSNKEVKQKLKKHIEEEDKKSPLSDIRLRKLLQIDGYNIARRTVAKYREQMNLPVARLRKEL